MGAMRFLREVLPLPRAVASDVEIVAVGDIHGRADLLDALLQTAAETPLRASVRRLVFTGDLVDRGPESLRALALAAASGARIGAEETVGLLGNHEILMRMALDAATPPRLALQALRIWFHNGGDATAEELIGSRVGRQDAARLLGALREATPEWVAAWLGGLRPYYRSGGVLFVHAGVNPSFPLEPFLDQPWDTPLSGLKEEAHWAWVRAPFLDHRPGDRGFAGFFVIHGHTPLDRGHSRGHAEQVQRFRLNLDGGSAMTGIAKMAIVRAGVAEIITVQSAG